MYEPSKPGSARERKESVPQPFVLHQPLIGDASVELECALPIGGGVSAKRDDERDLEFVDARKSWDAKEPGRNLRGTQIRKEFRTEFLEAPLPPPSERSSRSRLSVPVDDETTTIFEGTEDEEEKNKEIHVAESAQGQGPTPVSESVMHEMTVESEEEALYLLMPDQLRDKFIALHFLPFCMKEKNEDECVLVTPDMAEAARKDRHARMEAATERMRELQTFNEEHVLGRQRNRCQLLEKLFVDATLCSSLVEVMDQREDAIAQEILNRNLSATKKKLEAKKIEAKKLETRRK